MKFERVAGHHSFADWETFNVSGAVYQGSVYLSNSVYKTPPASLVMTLGSDPNHGDHAFMACKLPETIDILQGMITTWAKVQGQSGPNINPPKVRFGIGPLGDMPKFTAQFNLAINADWKRMRILWFNTWDVYENPKLSLRIDTWDGSQWIPGDITQSSVPRLVADGTNRVILYGQNNWSWYGYSFNIYFDETEIWRAA